ncbi:MAG: septum formation initiator family protein [Clostridia bacterium]|nr:septum formation initiator family protein [Clostridia bacterium]
MKEKSRRRSRSPNGKNILMRILVGMLLVLVLSSAVAIYFEQEKQIERINQRREELASELQEAAADLAGLKELQELAGSDAYIERVARDQLGMVRPDEIIFEED